MPDIIEGAAKAVHDCGLLLDADECEQAARAVLRAMREPNDMMMYDGKAILQNGRTEDFTHEVRSVYRAMIDAALSE